MSAEPELPSSGCLFTFILLTAWGSIWAFGGVYLLHVIQTLDWNK